MEEDPSAGEAAAIQTLRQDLSLDDLIEHYDVSTAASLPSARRRRGNASTAALVPQQPFGNRPADYQSATLQDGSRLAALAMSLEDHIAAAKTVRVGSSPSSSEATCTSSTFAQRRRYRTMTTGQRGFEHDDWFTGPINSKRYRRDANFEDGFGQSSYNEKYREDDQHGHNPDPGIGVAHNFRDRRSPPSRHIFYECAPSPDANWLAAEACSRASGSGLNHFVPREASGLFSSRNRSSEVGAAIAGTVSSMGFIPGKRSPEMPSASLPTGGDGGSNERTVINVINFNLPPRELRRIVDSMVSKQISPDDDWGDGGCSAVICKKVPCGRRYDSKSCLSTTSRSTAGIGEIAAVKAWSILAQEGPMRYRTGGDWLPRNNGSEIVEVSDSDCEAVTTKNTRAIFSLRGHKANKKAVMITLDGDSGDDHPDTMNDRNTGSNGGSNDRDRDVVVLQCPLRRRSRPRQVSCIGQKPAALSIEEIRDDDEEDEVEEGWCCSDFSGAATISSSASPSTRASALSGKLRQGSHIRGRICPAGSTTAPSHTSGKEMAALPTLATDLEDVEGDEVTQQEAQETEYAGISTRNRVAVPSPPLSKSSGSHRYRISPQTLHSGKTDLDRHRMSATGTLPAALAVVSRTPTVEDLVIELTQKQKQLSEITKKAAGGGEVNATGDWFCSGDEFLGPDGGKLADLNSAGAEFGSRGSPQSSQCEVSPLQRVLQRANRIVPGAVNSRRILKLAAVATEKRIAPETTGIDAAPPTGIEESAGHESTEGSRNED